MDFNEDCKECGMTPGFHTAVCSIGKSSRERRADPTRVSDIHRTVEKTSGVDIDAVNRGCVTILQSRVEELEAELRDERQDRIHFYHEVARGFGPKAGLASGLKLAIVLAKEDYKDLQDRVEELEETIANFRDVSRESQELE